MNNANMTSNRNLLADKELDYLSDFMSWELLAAKKCHHAAMQCNDPQIREFINQVGHRHLQHYENLLSHIQ